MNEYLVTNGSNIVSIYTLISLYDNSPDGNYGLLNVVTVLLNGIAWVIDCVQEKCALKREIKFINKAIYTHKNSVDVYGDKVFSTLPQRVYQLEAHQVIPNEIFDHIKTLGTDIDKIWMSVDKTFYLIREIYDEDDDDNRKYRFLLYNNQSKEEKPEYVNLFISSESVGKGGKQSLKKRSKRDRC